MPSSKSHPGPSQLHNSESSVIYPKESPTSDTQRDQQRQSSSEIYESLKAIEVFVQSVTAWDLPTPIRLRLSVLDLHLRRAFDNIKHINREEMLDLGRNALIIDEDIQQYSSEQQRRAHIGHAASR